MTASIRDLADNRDALLLAEVGAWLHMLGKYDERWISNTDGREYQKLCENLESYKLKALLEGNWPEKIWEIDKPSALKVAPGSIEQFMSKHIRSKHTVRTGIPNLLRVLVDAHGRGSGTEKGVLIKNKGRNGSYDKQGESEHYKKVHLCTAFGFESNPIELANRRHQLYEFLENQLQILKDSLTSPSTRNSGRWYQWRQLLIERLEADFSITVGDTRRPINDVTLWDQTAATVAFFKTELAEVILTKWRDPLQKGNEFKYRILRVGFDAYSYVAQSPRIGDILARNGVIEMAFEEVRKLIEVHYPLGLEVYRDANSIAFLVPDIGNLLDFTDDQGRSLRQLVEERFDSVFNGEVVLNVELSPSGSRNVFFAGKVMSAPAKPLSPSVGFLRESWKVVKDRCSVCQIRPQGYGADGIESYRKDVQHYSQEAMRRKMCCVCMDRVSGRSKEWATKKLDETIWIDEVSDINGRVALVAGRFDLGHWLTGEYVSTFRNPKEQCGATFHEIAGELAGRPEKKLKELEKFKRIAECYAGDIKGLTCLLIEDEDLGQDEFSSIPLDERLALAVWRKPPSFARIRRVWETTQNFWENSVKNKLGVAIDIVGPRLIITGDVNEVRNKLRSYNAYSVELKRGLETPLVYDEGRNRFINVSNLCYLAKRLRLQDKNEDITHEEAGQKLKEFLEARSDTSFALYEELAQGSERVQVATLSNCKVTIEKHDFVPAIPIVVDPAQLLVLVPADRALKLVQHIRNEYEAQFSKVRNRLPLHLNMVFFNRKQPISVALDAARRMLIRRSKDDAIWEIQSINETDSRELYVYQGERLTSACREIALRRIDGNTPNETCMVLISYGLGDLSKEDVWHPYFFADKEAVGAQQFNCRPYHFRAPFPSEKSHKMKDLVHVKDLVKGDRVVYSPCTLDFEFLDVTARRYELVYENEMRLPSRRKWATRPFLLEDLTVMHNLWKVVSTLSSSQLQQLAGLLEDWRDRWQVADPTDPTYGAFANHALQRAFGKDWLAFPEEDSKTINNWAANGRLLDLLELHMSILKQKPKGGTNNADGSSEEMKR